jgi:cellulose synthase/poly-beta-1,6-N-acetylglucosamine synthase-like glycosyltransferase
MNWLDPVAWVLAVLFSVPLLVLAVECLAASVRRLRTADNPPTVRVGCVVLIPAHDEEHGLGRTLDALAPELGPDDRVLVVADNCTDRTAEVARARGAEVVERFDPTRRGKGYALAFGLDALRSRPPAVVVILDADCVVAPGGLARLVDRAHARQRPVQAAYRMTPRPGSGAERRVAAFAFLVKNVVRPLGLLRLGQPCLLTGTGMAFPWPVIRDARLGHGHIVEDMQLAVDLVLDGHPPLFAPDVEVSAEFPVGDKAAGTQRRRWEHGHLRVLLAGVPRLLKAGLRGRWSPIALALELGVPPLSALVLTVCGVLCALVVWGVVGGSWLPAIVLASAAALASLGLAAAWLRCGRTTLPAATLIRTPLYVLRKVPLYLGFFARPQSDWVRTQRDETRGV